MKRRRRPGGGRKSEGEFRNLTAVMSLRMPQDLRDRLEQARKASRRSLSQELIARAEASFERDRGQSRDRALRAFCFLFSELMQVICVNPELMPDWRFNPWLFQAFRLAVPKLLDHFRPAGGMKLPEFWQFAREVPDVDGLPAVKEWGRRITESPEAMADHAVQKVLADFNNPQQVKRLYEGWKGIQEKLTDPADQRVAGYMVRELDTAYYGMNQAQRDLAPKPKGRK
jgi:hypothetical protein